MSEHVQNHRFPDGSEVELTVQTSDSVLQDITTRILESRMQSVYALFPLEDRDARLVAYASFAPGGHGTDHRSETSYQLPEGEVTATIDASGRAVHGYLNYLVADAVAYADVVDVDARRATVLAGALLGTAIALAASGRYFLSAPFFGGGGIVGFYLLVYWLASRGVFLNLSRRPDPEEPH